MKNKFTMLALTFIAGAVIGALIFWLTSTCCCHVSSGQTKVVDTQRNPVTGFGPTTVDIPKAKSCFQSYLSSFVSIDTLKGFSINVRQFNAMDSLLKKNPNLLGFRIYMGKDNGANVRLVVGFGSPDHTDDVYETSDENSGPCPYVCDVTSPIINP